MLVFRSLIRRLGGSPGGLLLLQPQASQSHRLLTSSSSGSKEDKGKGKGEDKKAPNDPFGFRELKKRWKEDHPAYPPISEADVAHVEEELTTKGKLKVARNVFDLKEVPKQMTDLWMAGVPPPQLNTRDMESSGLNSPYDLYWPGNLDDSLPEDEQMVPQPHPPVYSSYDLKAMEDRELGGVCKGKLQRRGNQPLKCNKIDLEELDFTNIPVLSNFLSPAGMIKPRRMTGLCAKCQRKVAKAIKRSRHMGIIPHTAGIQIYKQVEVPAEGDGPVIVTSTPATRRSTQRQPSLPYATI